MNDYVLDALRAEVDRHTGPARSRPLMALGQALATRYWQAGPGRPTAEPYLDEAVRVLDEAYGYLEPGGFPRGLQAGMLGWLVGARHVAHGSPVADRERGISLLDEALEFPQLPQMLRLVARLVLGQLLLSRVSRSMQSPGYLMRAMRSALSAEERASADRAVACFREVVDAPGANAELTSLAETLLALAETLRGVSAGFDLGRMMRALRDLQDLRQKAAAAAGSGTGFGWTPNPFDLVADDLAALDPIDRPVTVVEGAVPVAAPAPRSPAETEDGPPALPRIPATAFRTAFLDLLPGGSLAGVPDLVEGHAVELGVGTVDELVALASALVDTRDAVGADRVLLAVALYLRSEIDAGGGWGDDGEAADVRAARDNLLAAADAVVAAPADSVAVAFRLATLLDARQPARGVRNRLVERFSGVTKALRAVGADGLLYPAAGRHLLLSAATGSLAPAGSSVPARVLIAGDAPAPDGSAVSFVRSGAQLIELAGRARRPVTRTPVFVANPRGDRPRASMDALRLRRAFYPRSTGLGEAVENIGGAGTPDEVRARLDASLLHLGCGITADGGLELAGPGVLEPAQIAGGPPGPAGGLAVLPSAVPGAAALTDALLAKRFTGVVRFRDTVPDDVASLAYFVLHTQLVDASRSPASAVAAVRSWFADPRRRPPDCLPAWLVRRAADPGLVDPAYRESLVHHGT